MNNLGYLDSAPASESPLAYKMGIVFAALSFSIHSFDALLSELLHIEYSSLHTAVSMYVPLLLSLSMFMLVPLDGRVGVWLFESRGFILLCFVCGFWLANYYWEVSSPSDVSLSDYDRKRIWFFVHGVLLSGLLGVVASRNPARFIQLFLPCFCAFALLSSFLYLLTYRPGEDFERLLGEKALGAGVLAAFGAASCFSLLLLKIEQGRRLSGGAVLALTAVILVDVCAIALSATRGAALCCLGAVAAFAWMIRRSRQLIFVGFLIVLLCGVVSVGRKYLPEAAVNRIMMKEQGLDLRYDLASTVLGMIAENPYGRVLGYQDSNLQMDYSHNALLQYVAEAGLQSVPTLIILLGVMIWKLASCRSDRHVRALALFGLPVLAESFSAGSAYNSLLWFLLFFVFSLGEARQYDAGFPYDESCMCAHGPSFADDRIVR
jgi:Ca2+/Na+ antiporter